MSRYSKIVLLFLLIASISDTLYSQKFYEKEVSIYFDVDLDLLKEESKNEIRAKMLEVGTTNIREIHIKGHADSDASEIYNLDLSDRRAKSTSEYLIKQGVKPEMIKVMAYGESAPISQHKQYNRRVDLILKYVRNISENQIAKVRIIQGFVYNAVTKEHMHANFIIENNNNQINKSTTAKGYFRLSGDGNNDIALTFFKNNFLNEHKVILADEIALCNEDTLTVSIYLNPVEVLAKITLKNIYFYTDTDVLKPESYPDLELLLKTMKDRPQMLIEIQGHMNFAINRKMTAQQKDYNLYLSHKRAKAIYNYLVSHGIERKRLSYRGMSNFKMIHPIPRNLEEEDMNKRVEIYSLRIINS